MDKNRQNSKMDMYNVVLDSPKKKKSSNTNKKNTEFKKPINYTKANVEETIENFNKVKKIIDEESRKKKKSQKKKMNKSLKNFIIFSIIFWVLVITIITLILTLPIFKLESVYMVNAEEYSADEIATTINLEFGENIFIAMFKARKANLASVYPLIETVNYKYSFPNKVGFSVVARNKRYYVYNKEDCNYYTLSDNGYILAMLKDSSNWSDEILVSGITFENNVTVGTKINDIDYSKLKNFETFYESLVKNIENVKITRVTFENIYMKIYINSSVEVIFKVTDSPSKYSMSMLKIILKDVDGQKGTIDMTKENPTFVKN